MKEFDRFSFRRNYSGKVPLIFPKFPEKFRRKFPEISDLTTLDKRDPRFFEKMRHPTCYQGRIQSVSLWEAEPMSSAPPVPSPPPFLPSFPPLSLPVPPLLSLSFPSLIPFPFPSLSSPSFPFPPLSLKRGVRGSSPKNFEILDCCRRVLAHSGMQKGVCKCVFLGRAMNFFLAPV